MFNRKSLVMKLIIFTGITLLLVIGTTITFYLTSSTAMRKEAARLTNAYFTHINGQIMSSVADNAHLVEIFSFDSSVQNYLTGTNPADKYTAFLNVSNLYNTAMSIKLEFKDLIIVDNNMQAISVGGLIYDFNKVNNYYNSEQNNQDITVSVCDFSSVFDAQAKYSLVSTSPVYKNIGQNRQRIGGLMFIMDLKPVIDTMDAIKFTLSSHTFLFNQDDELLCGTAGSEGLQKMWKDSNIKQFDQPTIQLDGVKYMQFVSRHSKADFYFRSFVPLSDVYVYSDDYNKNTFILIAVNAIAILIMALYINRSFRKPLHELLNSMEAVKKGDLSSRASIVEESEIGMLVASFNEMMNKIQSMTKTIVENQARMYELEILSSRMELKALQNQINPHFLYNTLACIQGIAICNNEEEILKITKALSDIYRYILRVPDVVSLKAELDNIQNYLIIQKIRFGDRLQIKQDIRVDINDKQILKLLLQPLVENAVEHGIGEKVGGGEISILICQNFELNRLEITVEDNGVGMSQQALNEFNRSLCENLSVGQDHVGMKSVVSRLRLAYHENFTLQCTSHQGKVTKVFLSLPYIKNIFLSDGTPLLTKEKNG